MKITRAMRSALSNAACGMRNKEQEDLKKELRALLLAQLDDNLLADYKKADSLYKQARELESSATARLREWCKNNQMDTIFFSKAYDGCYYGMDERIGAVLKSMLNRSPAKERERVILDKFGQLESTINGATSEKLIREIATTMGIDPALILGVQEPKPEPGYDKDYITAVANKQKALA